MRAHGVFVDSLGEIRLIASHAEQVLQELGGNHRMLGNALTRSGLVLLSGSFEGFLRDLVSEYIEEIGDRRIAFPDLPTGFVCSAAEKILQLKKNGKLDELRKAAKAIATGTDFQFDYKKMANTGGNPTVDVVEDLFTSLGHPNVIETLSIQDFGIDSTYSEERRSDAVRARIRTALQGHVDGDLALTNVLTIIDEAWTPRRKRRDVGYVSAIQQLLSKRNRIAHGEGRDEITPTDLSSHVEGIGRLAAGLTSILDNSLADLDALMDESTAQATH
jgi:hypothetical protein